MEEDVRKPGFWQDSEKAKDVSHKLNEFKEEVGIFPGLKKELEDIARLKELGEEETVLEKEIEKIENKERSALNKLKENII